ncbi:MAG TPA: polysaccharide export protein [Bacteroidetes bacterium]|nr:polysaccharide export protein [Bacteroidota bacterium]
MNLSTRLLALLLLFLPVVALSAQDEPKDGPASANRFNTTVVGHRSTYPLGPGDRIRVTIFDEESLEEEGRSVEFTLSDDGLIFLPLVGEINALGRTAVDLERDLVKRYGAYLVHPRVRVELLETIEHTVALLGACRRQGVYPVLPGTRLTRFIAENGGLLPEADVERVTVIRTGGDMVVVDLSAFFSVGDTSQDLVLAGGDRVFIPARGRDFLDNLLRIAQIANLALQVLILVAVLSK